MSRDFIGGLTLLPGGASMIAAAADGKLSLLDARTSGAAALAAQVRLNCGKQPLLLLNGILKIWCLFYQDPVSVQWNVKSGSKPH